MDAESMRSMIFNLCWQQHGGSGLLVTVGEAEQMTINEAIGWLKMIGDRRAAEAADIRKAAK